MGFSLKGVVRGVTNAVQDVGHAFDVTYSKGLVGQYTAPVARPVVATAAAALTGGASLLRADQRAEAIKGWKMGAAIGSGAKAGGALGAVQAGAKATAGAVAEPPAESPAQPGDVQLSPVETEGAQAVGEAAAPLTFGAWLRAVFGGAR